MIIVTGPRSTDDGVGHVAEMAGLLDAVPAYSAVAQWVTATALYCIAGWESCPLAVADVVIAEECGLPVHHLTV
ncbi:hypothetical protein ACE1SV_12590 [Streptomyces sennicomposti]